MLGASEDGHQPGTEMGCALAKVLPSWLGSPYSDEVLVQPRFGGEDLLWDFRSVGVFVGTYGTTAISTENAVEACVCAAANW
jgi:hypothetical protein